MRTISVRFKSEGRNPKAERIPKPDAQNPADATDASPSGMNQIRPSAFGLFSDFGFRISDFALGIALAGLLIASPARAAGASRTYENKLTPLKRPKPLLADHPEWVEPIRETNRWEAPAIVNDPNADLHVRAWRWSYNARGIIEMPNHLRARQTAIILVHPWGIDDGQGWNSPEPAGVADFCTPGKNHLAAKHTRGVIDPFLKSLRGKVAVLLYSLPGSCDPIRLKLYRSFTHNPGPEERKQGAQELDAKLRDFKYRGEPLPATLSLTDDKPVVEYFKQFPGLDANARYNNAGFWDLPIPVTRDITVFPDDV
ncbi:MAG: hypothetical protein DME26_18170, partial [Verrucomicrobia bacterium]